VTRALKQCGAPAWMRWERVEKGAQSVECRSVVGKETDGVLRASLPKAWEKEICARIRLLGEAS
jgi:hypothetical protein